METTERLIEIICSRFEMDRAVLKENTTFDEINADSIDLVDLVMEIEEEFSVSIKDEDFENIRTIGDLAALIDS